MWEQGAPGVMELPSGRLVRGRGLRHGPAAAPFPAYGVYLLGKEPPPVDWESLWLRWPDGWLPSDPDEAKRVLTEALERAGAERVEFACSGGLGRTGTALACLAVLDGVPAERAVEYVRRNYHRRAVEMPWQKRFVRRFTR